MILHLISRVTKYVTVKTIDIIKYGINVNTLIDPTMCAAANNNPLIILVAVNQILFLKTINSKRKITSSKTGPIKTASIITRIRLCLASCINVY